jgi:hypothetical protein
MPFDCRHRQQFGPDVCLADCAAKAVFSAVAVGHRGGEPPADDRVIDVAVLDMHHGWPNLGHDAIVHAMRNAVCDLAAPLGRAGLAFRVLSYDVRRGHAIPDPPGVRHTLYVGTGGPGHLDPRRNDGVSDGAQGIEEDPAWEPALFGLFEAIRDHDEAALLGVCHTFGVMCRWLGVADAVQRGPEKGGKSTGIVDNQFTDDGAAHPWFGRLTGVLGGSRRFRVLDNRLFDLRPSASVPAGVRVLATEVLASGEAGDGITMIEAGRTGDGIMPRVLGVNHHPEIVNRSRLLAVLEEKFSRGDVTRDWYEERRRSLTDPVADEWGDRLLHLTSSYTFMGPLRYHLYRLARLRAERLGARLGIDEAMLPLIYSAAR